MTDEPEKKVTLVLNESDADLVARALDYYATLQGEIFGARLNRLADMCRTARRYRIAGGKRR